jgi:hypothetical protein
VSAGRTLAKARRDRGLTVAQVSQRTRIRQTIITAIEADDYSGCGGDFYARGHIRSIAKAVGVDPQPLVEEYDSAHGTHGPLTAVSLDALVASARTRRRRRTWPPLLGVVLVVALGGAAAALLVGPAHPAHPVAAAGTTSSGHRPGNRSAARSAKHRSPGAQPSSSTAPGAVLPARILVPVSATAFGPAGAGTGDNQQLAGLAIDGNPRTSWHTDWYTSARFGNLYRGTGLLLNMGRTVAISSVQVSLGTPGAGLQVRAGANPVFADLTLVARQSAAGTAVTLAFPHPVQARYLLIWFTRLPVDPAGTYEESVSGVMVRGTYLPLPG